MIKDKIEGKKVLVKGLKNCGICKVVKEYENGEVLYKNGNIGRVEDIIKIIK